MHLRDRNTYDLSRYPPLAVISHVRCHLVVSIYSLVASLHLLPGLSVFSFPVQPVAILFSKCCFLSSVILKRRARHVSAHVYVSVRACVRACVRVFVRARVCLTYNMVFLVHYAMLLLLVLFDRCPLHMARARYNWACVSVDRLCPNHLKLTFRKYPSIPTNYIISHSTILQYNHNILYRSYAEKKY